MDIFTVVLLVVVFAVAGFILGFLVFRNNSTQLNKLTDTVIDLAEQIKDLKK